MDMHASGPPPATPPIEELLRHAGWVRHLAGALAGSAGADDLVQDAWVTALERPPKSVAHLRGWLARVLTNRARSLGRSEQRRARREAAGAQRETGPSTDELLSELELARRVAGAVRELDEPYRTVVLLRFYRDLSPAVIAAQQGLPAATVRSHLRRGLDQLRARFDREHRGERNAWSAAMLAWARPERSLVAASGLALAGWSGLALVTVGGVGWLLIEGEPTSRAEPAVALAGEPSRAPTEDRTNLTQSAEFADDTGGTREPAPVAPAPVPSGGALYTGSVHTPDGTPIEGATLSLYPSSRRPHPTPIATGTTDANGRFAFAAAPTSSTDLVIVAEASGFQGVTRDSVLPSGGDTDIELGWMAELFGVVREAGSGTPLAGVRIANEVASTLSDAQGAYRLGGFPAGVQREIRARLAGHAALKQQVILPGKEPQPLDLELEPGVPVEIEVFDEESGAPLAGVEVRDAEWDESWTRTAEDGHFTLHVAPDLEFGLSLSCPGYWPMRWEWWPVPDDIGPLRLPMARQLWLEGRIRDSHGATLEGAWVYVTTQEPRNTGDDYPRPFESLEIPGNLDLGTGGEALCQSDAHGRYRLPILASEHAYVLSAGREDFVNEEDVRLHFPAGSTGATLDLVLSPGARIHGRALFAGDPWEERMAVRAPSGKKEVASTWVDEDGSGSYSMDGVPPGTWSIGPAGPAATDLPSVTLTVEAGKVYEHDFVWGEASNLGAISGRVLVAGNPPARESRVAARRLGATEDADMEHVREDGTFVLRVPAGSYEVYASRSVLNGTVRSEVHIADTGTEGLELALPEVGVLRLRLVDATMGAAVRAGTGVSVLHWRRTDVEARGDAILTIDVAGGAELELPVGDYEIEIDLSEPNYRRNTPVRLSVSGEREPDPHVIRFERGVEARVHLVPEGEFELPRAQIFLLERSQLDSVSGPYPTQGPPSNHRFNGIDLRIDDPGLLSQHLGGEFFDGGALVQGLVPGDYFLRAFPDELVFEPSEFHLAGPERAEFRVRWRRK